MVKVAQFGEGNFLRAFADLYFEEVGGLEVSVIKPRPGAIPEAFAAQNNRYHVLMRGVEQGRAIECVYPVNVIKEVIDPFQNRSAYNKLAKEESLKIIVSNTTEAGICFCEKDDMDDFDHMTFPGKLTLFLYERYKANCGGVYLLPVELIDNNADTLCACVEKYISAWQLPDQFRKWNKEQNFYCNTLVDRIVSGFPRDPETQSHLEELIGEPDGLMTVAEPFGLWVVEEKGQLAQLLPAGKHNIEMVLTHDVRPYKKRKVRVLNCSHTNLVAAGLLHGMNTVYDCMHDPALSAFARNTLEHELVPYVAESKHFADAVLERFANPYLNHQLTGIALNSIAKWRARVLPGFKECFATTGTVPQYLTVGFSYLMALYAGVRREADSYYAGKIPVSDERDYLDYFAEGGSVEEFMKKIDIWGEDLTRYPGFAQTVCKNVAEIQNGKRLL